MGLKGINSMKDSLSSITKDIEDFLIKDKWKIATKSIETKYTDIKGNIHFHKYIGGDSTQIFYGYVTGSQIIVENTQKDNDEGAEIFNRDFSNEEEFVDIYNELVVFLKEKL